MKITIYYYRSTYNTINFKFKDIFVFLLKSSCVLDVFDGVSVKLQYFFFMAFKIIDFNSYVLNVY